VALLIEGSLVGVDPGAILNELQVALSRDIAEVAGAVTGVPAELVEVLEMMRQSPETPREGEGEEAVLSPPIALQVKVTLQGPLPVREAERLTANLQRSLEGALLAGAMCEGVTAVSDEVEKEAAAWEESTADSILAGEEAEAAAVVQAAVMGTMRQQHSQAILRHRGLQNCLGEAWQWLDIREDDALRAIQRLWNAHLADDTAHSNDAEPVMGFAEVAERYRLLRRINSRFQAEQLALAERAEAGREAKAGFVTDAVGWAGRRAGGLREAAVDLESLARAVAQAISDLFEAWARREHPDIGEVPHELLPNHEFIGATPEVEKGLREVLERREQAMVEAQGRTVETLRKTAMAQMRASLTMQSGSSTSLTQAEKSVARALALQELVLGNQHPDLVETLEVLADILAKLNRMEEGRAARKRAEALAKAKEKFLKLGSPRSPAKPKSPLNLPSPVSPLSPLAPSGS